MRHLKYIFIPALLVMLVSCDTLSGDPDLPIPLEETMNNTGAFLRIASVQSAAFDLADMETATYAFEGEYFDGEGSTLLENVEFYASYESFALDPANVVTIDETTDPVFTVPSSAFSVDEESGLPTANISVPFLSVAEGLGLDTANVEIEDKFTLRWDVNLTDGRTFTAKDASPALGGGFYNSPYRSTVFTVKQLPESDFVGTYTFEAQNTGVFGWWTFSETFNADLSVDPANTLNGRVFTAEPYAEDWGGLAPITVPIALGQTAAVTSEVGTGLGCGVGLAVGPLTDDNNKTLIDVEDDSQFTLVLADNTRSDCGATPTDIFFTVTKQ